MPNVPMLKTDNMKNRWGNISEGIECLRQIEQKY